MTKTSNHTITGKDAMITIGNHTTKGYVDASIGGITINNGGSWTLGKHNINGSMMNTDATDPVKVIKELIKAGVFTAEELVDYYRHTRISNALSGKGVYLASTEQKTIDQVIADLEIEKMIEG